MKQYVGNMEFVKNMKEYEEICGKYEGVCGKYEGLCGKYEGISLTIYIYSGTWENSEPSLPI